MNPIQHKRGSTFSLAFSLPDCIDEGFFSTWKVEAQLRKEGNTMPSGLIAQLSAQWDDPFKAKNILLFYEDTTSWAVCDAYLDVRLVSSTGHVRHSESVPVSIISGVTK